jgi:hypothetical protein
VSRGKTTQSRDAGLAELARAALYPQTVYPTPGRHGVPRPIDDQRIGHSIELVGHIGGGVSQFPPPVRLLDVSLQQIAAAYNLPDKQWDTGSWELAISAELLTDGTGSAYAGAIAGQLAVVPLLAQIQMGIGNARIPLEVSPFPSCSIPLPCDRVIVDVGFDTFNRGQYQPAVNRFVLPNRVRVTALVQRSTGAGDARRTFNFFVDAVDTGPFRDLVPPFAKSVMVFSGNPLVAYAAGANLILQATTLTEAAPATAVVVTDYSGPILQLIWQSGARADVPGAARFWQSSNIPAPTASFFVDFEIGL